MSASLVGSEMCIRDRLRPLPPAATYVHQRTSMMQNTATRPVRGHLRNLTLTYLRKDEQTT
eukprot:5320527-Alexandrium_andersonii.AAC.1